jgi:hypothetical protein
LVEIKDPGELFDERLDIVRRLHRDGIRANDRQTYFDISV